MLPNSCCYKKKLRKWALDECTNLFHVKSDYNVLESAFIRGKHLNHWTMTRYSTFSHKFKKKTFTPSFSLQTFSWSVRIRCFSFLSFSSSALSLSMIDCSSSMRSAVSFEVCSADRSFVSSFCNSIVCNWSSLNDDTSFSCIRALRYRSQKFLFKKTPFHIK